MKPADFWIGMRFRCGDKNWMCTDVGRRVVVGVCTDPFFPAAMFPNAAPVDPQRDGWLNGPPYALEEVVFDEYDLGVCERIIPSNMTWRQRLSFWWKGEMARYRWHKYDHPGG